MNLRLTLSLLLPFIACAMQWLLWDALRPYVWFLFFPAVFFSAWIGGLVGGLAATLIGALLAWYVFIPPAFSFTLDNPASAFSVVVFIAMGGLFAFFFERLQHAKRGTDAALAAAEAANKELEAFSYSVSHDLRAPLRAIDGFSRKLVLAYGDKLDQEGRRLLQVVRDNAQSMGNLIDDLLAFSRMGRREMARQTLDMDAMARSVADELRAAEPRRAIEFAFSPLPRASGDAAMLRQVWANLLANAVKFTRQRRLAHIEVGGRVEGGEALYWVRDDGAGFDIRYADKLFGVFQRLHRQDEFEGTGVGLAIAQRILHRHHGRIWGEGKPDAGATFRFTLPLPALPRHISGGPSS